MKIHCIDRKGSTLNTFLCKINQHTILINCPLEQMTIPQPESNAHQPTPNDNQQQQPKRADDLGSILSSFSTLGKRVTDTQYSSYNTTYANCDQRTAFRIPDFDLVDIESIDLVVISNSQCLVGLPFLTEYLGYKGRILATEPTIEYGKQRMKELVIEHGPQFSPSRIEPTHAAHFSQLSNTCNTNNGWRSIYSMKDITSCIEKIQPVGYNETLSLFSTLNVTAFSAGYSLGSTNWLLETSFKRIAFLSYSSIHASLHPAPFDTAILENADVIVVGGLTESYRAEQHEEEETETSSPFEKAKAKLLTQIARTVQSQHNAVIVTPSAGLLFDLIGDIHEYFRSIGMEIGRERHQTCIYAVSPVADESLKYANICGEWMNAARVDLLSLSQMPVAHGELMQKDGVQTFNSLDVSALSNPSKLFREPCIVFTGDSSCPKKGSLSWFLEHWGDSEKNLCAFIDPDTPQPIEDIIPAQCKMNVFNIPLDTRLRLSDIPSLLIPHWRHHENNVKHLLLPRMLNSNISGSTVDTLENKMTRVQYYEPSEVISIDVNRHWESVSVSEKLAKTIDCTVLPSEHGKVPRAAWAPITGSLNFYNNRLEIQPSFHIKDEDSIIINNPSDYKLNTELSTLIRRFEEYHLNVSITKDPNGTVKIELPKDMDAWIIIDEHSTVIVASNASVRALLRKITVTNLREL